VTSRIKIMARLNIAERRLPQDGRTRLTVRGKDIDLRVSTMPTLYGESVVLRILDRTTNRLDFEQLGFGGELLSHFRKVLAQPNGIVLVTGPTGSGKTTTLYTALASLNSPELKLFTVEDPIEYNLQGINQIQVQPKIGLTFASALRSILRQDPDIVMIGEIRDKETAEIAIQASLTGHLVFSTVHTNSAAATVVRLLDMGIESYLLASSLSAVLAQRLVRRLCKECATPRAMPRDLIRRIVGDAHGQSDAAAIDTLIASGHYDLRQPVGCPACRNTGYAGRTTVAELLEMSDAVRQLVLAGASEQAIEDAGRAGGMISMYSNGLAKVLAGETTLEEVLQVTRIR
jgi:general secretion pathway protein E